MRTCLYWRGRLSCCIDSLPFRYCFVSLVFLWYARGKCSSWRETGLVAILFSLVSRRGGGAVVRGCSRLFGFRIYRDHFLFRFHPVLSVRKDEGRFVSYSVRVSAFVLWVSSGKGFLVFSLRICMATLEATREDSGVRGNKVNLFFLWYSLIIENSLWFLWVERN